MPCLCVESYQLWANTNSSCLCTCTYLKVGLFLKRLVSETPYLIEDTPITPSHIETPYLIEDALITPHIETPYLIENAPITPHVTGSGVLLEFDSLRGRPFDGN